MRQALRTAPSLVLLTCLLPLFGEAPAGGPSSPGPRNAHGMAYDLRDSSLVLFGGATSDEVRGDTWRWKQGVWRLVTSAGPGPRTFPAMVYDAGRGEIVLFGGNRVLFGDGVSPAVLLGDTWVLRRDGWTRPTVQGPGRRAEAAMAYDAARRRTVLFGGWSLLESGERRRLGDTWEWDGRRWTHASDTGPAPRSGAAMAYSPEAGGVVLFGGSGGPLGDTWRWNGTAWIRATGPAPGRFNSVMARDPGAARLVRTGGWDGERRVSETWRLLPGGWSRVEGVGPPARNHAALVSAPDRTSLLLYGGHDGEHVFADLWEWRDGHWRLLESAEPVARVPNGH